MEDVFSAEYYDTMVRHLPADEAYTSTFQRGDADYGKEGFRGVVEFVMNEQLMKMTDRERTFWLAASDRNPTSIITNVMLNTFSQFFDVAALVEKFGNDMDVFGKWLLSRDRAGYELPVHLDTTRKLVATLFYLPGPGLESGEGTTILTPKPGARLESNARNRFHRDEFDVVCKFPFKPNTMLAFARSANSFHCVDELGAEIDRRDILLFNVFGSKSGQL